MPCNDNMGAYFDALREELKKDPDKFIESQLNSINSTVAHKVNELVSYLKCRLDTTTRLLCFVCKQIELGDNANMDCAEAKELREWWKAHKEADEQRESE